MKDSESETGRVITLATDFGTRDGYVGAMKGVIYSLAPGHVRVVDITHEINPGNVSEAALVLETYHRFFPRGTIHLVIVDPGVGGSRRALAVESDGRFYVGPDNGVFEPVFNSSPPETPFRCFELTCKDYHLEHISRTFHGRDIFAPVAAHLAGGAALESLGPGVDDPVRPAGRPAGKKPVQGELTGRIIHVDRFGNLVTDITAGELTALGADFSSLRVSLCGEQIQGISEYYSQAGEGALLALVGSSGRLEVAAGGRSAHNSLGRPGPDTVVTVNSGKV